MFSPELIDRNLGIASTTKAGESRNQGLCSGFSAKYNPSVCVCEFINGSWSVEKVIVSIKYIYDYLCIIKTVLEGFYINRTTNNRNSDPITAETQL